MRFVEFKPMSFSDRNSLTLIAGPCSAESLEQLRTVAAFFKRWNAHSKDGMKVNALRAGVWKPRTRPGSFEGHGEKALVWLRNIKQEYGIPVATEVATAQHVALCLDYGIDILWIGARTTSNPFLMEEIAQALRGCSVPVWVKNPLSPDTALWMGAIERISRYSKGPVGAVHRGFGMYDSAPYRNAPLWEIAVEIKRLCPGMPLLCDPSHIGGKREYLLELAQSGLDLEMDGLMMEVHPEPEKALSDKDQQLTLPEFEELMGRLVVRNTDTLSGKMSRIRHILDEVDDELVQVLSRRMQLVKELGKLKRDENFSVLQLERWNVVVARVLANAERRGLNAGFVKQVLDCIHSEAIRLQKDILQGKE